MNEQADLKDRDEPLTKELNRLGADLHLAQTELRAAERDAAKGGEVQSESDRVALAQAEQAVEDARDCGAAGEGGGGRGEGCTRPSRATPTLPAHWGRRACGPRCWPLG